jgi:hypothetical protein
MRLWNLMFQTPPPILNRCHHPQCRDGAAYRLTEDHKPHLPRERARIEEAGGRVDFQRCWRVVVEPRDGRPGSGLAVSRCVRFRGLE